MSERSNQLLGNYRLVRQLGQGGFSDVYLGEHIHLGTHAAIKILRTQLAEDSVEAFRTEARTLAGLQHPNIVRVLDFGIDGTTPYLVMQYAPNGTLRQRHQWGTPVAPNVVVSYVQQLASALQYAHNRKLVHRDIKPENMLVSEQNQILLSDFGIAIVTASARATNPSDPSWNSAGTVTYMAPEQIQGHTVVASDQYALAIVVYEWLTGRPPFHGSYMEVLSQQMAATPPPMRAPAINAEIEQVVFTALNKDPQRRFGHIEAFSNALKQAVQGSTTPDIVSQKTPEVPNMEATLIGPSGRTLIGAAPVTIGRAPDCTIVLGDMKASFHHAEIRQEGQLYILIDLGSSGGTFVNAQQIASRVPRVLQPRDVIRIGDTTFTFEMNDGLQVSDGRTVRGDAPINPALPASNTSYGDQAPTYITPNQAPPNYTPNQAVPNYTPNQAAPNFIPNQAVPNYTANQPPASYTQPVYTAGGYNPPSYTPPAYTPTPPMYTPQQPVNTPPPQKRSPLRAILLGVAALIIILASIGGFTLYHNNVVAQDNIHATATAQQQAAFQKATAAAQQQATAAAQQATATAQVTSTHPPFTTLALNDPMKQNSASQWDSGSVCQFTSTGYQISIAQVGSYQWCRANSTNFGDFAYRVTMTITQGNCGGMILRDIDLQNYYLVEVCQDGTFNAGINVKDKLTMANNGQARTSDAIHKGLNQTNIIDVTLQGGVINLYINNSPQPVDTFTDSANTFTQGHVGLLADAVSSPTVVTYTNALVWTD